MAGQHPETKHERADLEIPANTAEASPVTGNVDLGEVVLDAIVLLVPRGHAGLTGIQVRYDDEVILPWAQSSEWFVGDGIERRFFVGFEVSHPLVLRGFNTDEAFPHTFYLTMEYRDLGLGPADAGEPADRLVPIA